MKRVQKKRTSPMLVGIVLVLFGVFGAGSSFAQDGGQVSTLGKIQFTEESGSDSSSDRDTSSPPLSTEAQKPQEESRSDVVRNETQKVTGRLPSTGEKMVRYGGGGLLLLLIVFVWWRIKQHKEERE